jgi:hypothetical protein
MNITLRKANAVQHSIQDTLKSIKADTHIDINEFQDPAQELKKANDALFQADARKQKLLLALYNIRGLVGTANAQSGIDLALAKAAFIDKRIEQLTEVAGLKPFTDLEIIKGKLEKIRNRKDDSRSIYGRDESVSTSVVSQEQIDQAKSEIKNLRKQKQKLNDEVLELNIKTEIPLSEEAVETLTAEGLI